MSSVNYRLRMYPPCSKVLLICCHVCQLFATVITNSVAGFVQQQCGLCVHGHSGRGRGHVGWFWEVVLRATTVPVYLPLPSIARSDPFPSKTLSTRCSSSDPPSPQSCCTHLNNGTKATEWRLESYARAHVIVIDVLLLLGICIWYFIVAKEWSLCNMYTGCVHSVVHVYM